MSTSGTKSPDEGQEKQLAKIIQGETIDLYGAEGCKSIIQTMMQSSGRQEEEIITNYRYLHNYLKGYLEDWQNQKYQIQLN